MRENGPSSNQFSNGKSISNHANNTTGTQRSPETDSAATLGTGESPLRGQQQQLNFLHRAIGSQQRLISSNQTSSCDGCREVRREVNELRQIIAQLLLCQQQQQQSTSPSRSSTTSATPQQLGNSFSLNHHESPRHPQVNSEHSQAALAASHPQQQQRQAMPNALSALLSPATASSLLGVTRTQHSADCPLTSANGIPLQALANCNPQHLLPWLLGNGEFPPGNSLLSPTGNSSTLGPSAQRQTTPQQQQQQTLRLLEQLSPTLLEAALIAGGPPGDQLWHQQLQQLNNLPSLVNGEGQDGGSNSARFAELVQAASAVQQLAGSGGVGGSSNRRLTGSMSSESSTVSQQSNSHLAMQHQLQQQLSQMTAAGGGGYHPLMEAADASETSSSASSSTNTHMVVISPQHQQQQVVSGQLQTSQIENASLQSVKGSTVSGGGGSTLAQGAQLAIAAAAAVTRGNSFPTGAGGTANTLAQFLFPQQQSGDAVPGGGSPVVGISGGVGSAFQPHTPSKASTLQLLQATLMLQQQQHSRQSQHRQQQENLQQELQRLHQQQQQHGRTAMAGNMGGTPQSSRDISSIVGGGSSERQRRASTDDYVRSVRQHNLSDEYIDQIRIPVEKAYQIDPSFRPLSEQQVVQQVMQSKKYENVNVLETMAQLCKKLAEKRVFGSRLMSETTVAAPNHSTYSNLPIEGIVYIQHVCRRVLGPRVSSDEEFWDLFREAMRKLAARCRRVRHAKKMRSPQASTNNVMLVANHAHQHNHSSTTNASIPPLEQCLPASSHVRHLTFEEKPFIGIAQHQQQLPGGGIGMFAAFADQRQNAVRTKRQSLAGADQGDEDIEDVMEVETMAESSSSPSPQSPTSSASRQSTPAPQSPSSNATAVIEMEEQMGEQIESALAHDSLQED